MKKVYISGKISGLEDRNAPKFEAAEKLLTLLGYEAINPLKILAFDEALNWSDYMRADIKVLCECDAIFLLDDWLLSPGAKLEVLIALRLGLKVLIDQEDSPPNTVTEVNISIAGLMGIMYDDQITIENKLHQKLSDLSKKINSIIEY